MSIKRICHLCKRVEMHGPERSRRIEQLAQATLPAHTLMRRAGSAVARLALALAPHAQRVWIAAGPGNNGGDGFDAAIELMRAGKEVHITLVGDAAKLPADACDAYKRAQTAGVMISAQPKVELSRQDLAIDALLGLGTNRPPQSHMAQVIRSINALPCPVLAVDLPSGLNAFTGELIGTACVRAQQTLSLLTLKPGLYTAQGRDHAGDVWWDDLGIDISSTEPDAWLSRTEQALFAPRAHAQHKGSFGKLAVIGGAAGMIGAALLAARAALAAGAGRLYISLLDSDPSTAVAFDTMRPELMFCQAWWRGAPEFITDSTVVCGCGGGDAVCDTLPRLLSLAPRIVLDADALNAIANDSNLQAQLRARDARGYATVLTPHPLEAARLLGQSVEQVQANRLHSAQALSENFMCAVLLKGSGSIIAAPECVPHVNPTGSASLATAGTGDVLAGWLGGLWAQQGADTRNHLAFRVAVSAAYTHGAAADAAGLAPLRAADLVEKLAQSNRNRH